MPFDLIEGRDGLGMAGARVGAVGSSLAFARVYLDKVFTATLSWRAASLFRARAF